MELLYANSPTDSHSFQSSCQWLMNEHRYCLTDWFMHSVWPSVHGWYAVDLFYLMLSNEKNSVRYLETNLVSRLWMVFFGSPWSRTTWSLKIHANPCDVSSMWIGSNLTALVKQSTITRMASYPWDSGNGPIMLVEMVGWRGGVVSSKESRLNISITAEYFGTIFLLMDREELEL
jgi:hypothetical protein